MSSAPRKIYTIGHSTRSLRELVDLLKENGVTTLADIRRYPGSRRYPHFSSDSLAAELPAYGLRYIQMPALGGRRKTRPDSPNTIWRNEQFRGYADHMATPEFLEAVHALLQVDGPAAVMCAEAVPWRCHRNLLSDDLVRRGAEVIHILGPASTKPHTMNPAAKEMDGHLIYPAEDQTNLF